MGPSGFGLPLCLLQVRSLDVIPSGREEEPQGRWGQQERLPALRSRALPALRRSFQLVYDGSPKFVSKRPRPTEGKELES